MDAAECVYILGGYPQVSCLNKPPIITNANSLFSRADHLRYESTMSQLPGVQSFDLVVVGTGKQAKTTVLRRSRLIVIGWFGLAAARSYISLHPEEDVVVLEAADTCGGTWGEKRIYPGLKSNNLIGRYEYPDLPMDEKIYGVKEREHIPGMVLHRYLTDFAKQNGVFERTRFNHKLESITPQNDDTWMLDVLNNGSMEKMRTKKLILATGLTSMPNMPTYKGQENFGAPLFHAKDFYAQRETLKTSKNAVIIGGAKSAYDVAWAYCDAGVQVDLVIRPNGNGEHQLLHIATS